MKATLTIALIALTFAAACAPQPKHAVSSRSEINLMATGPIMMTSSYGMDTQER